MLRIEDAPTPTRTLRTDDGATLAVTTWEPPHGAAASALLLPGVGVPRRAFRHLGAWLAAHGVRAWALDYRGMGDSRAGRRGASLSAWGEDAAAAFREMERVVGAPPAVVGHSFGGQALGLADDFVRAPAIALYGSQLGDWRLWDGVPRLATAGYWYAGLPLAAALFDPVPAWVGLGRLPAGVAREWSRWGRTRGYFLPHVPEARARYAALRMPVRVHSFTDDDIAPPRAARALVALFPPGRVDHVEVTPAMLGCDRIGHFGVFRAVPALPLWQALREFLCAHA